METTSSKKLKRIIVIFTLILIVLIFHHHAFPQYATGGSGIYRNNIHWFIWGAEGSSLSSGTSHSYTATSGSSTFTITCTISNFSSGATFYAYRPGTWGGDGLDNLYNIGGADAGNTFVNAISVPEAAIYTMRYTCSSLLNGNAYTLPGIVLADAEQSSNNGTEFIQGNALSGGTWRIIDRYRDCTASQVGLLTGTTLKISGVSPNCTQGPMSVAFLDGGSSIDATIKGGGISAIAVGVFINQDFGDASVSYGSAVHINSPSWSGGTLTSGTNTNVNDAAFTLGTIGTPTLRLGSLIDYEAVNQPNTAATGDDSTTSPGIDDEDGVTLPATVTRGKSVSVPVAVNGSGRLNVWVDWNRDGDFADSGEQVTNDQSVSTGTTTLSIAVPTSAALGTSYARFRLCSAAGACNSPNGIAANGEAEDYSLTIVSPNLSITKSSNGPWTVGQLGAAYTLTATNSGSISTFGPITVKDSLPTGITPNWSGTRTVISNGITWACAFSGLNVTCSTSNIIANTGTNTSLITLPVNVTSSAASGTNTNYASIGGGGDMNNSGTAPAPGASCADATHCANNAVTVNFPDLTIAKTHTGSFTRGRTGTYTLAVSNAGVVASSGAITVTDTLPSGLRVNGGTAGAVSIGGINASSWICNSDAPADTDAAQIVTCTSSTLIGAGSSSSFTLTVQVTAAAPLAGITNTAAVSGGGESNIANNTAIDATAIVVDSNVTFSNHQCGSNANLRTLVDWSNTALPSAFSGGSYTFTDPSSGEIVTVSSTASSIKRTTDGGIPSPFGTQYLEILNDSPTVTITLSQAVRIQTMLADVDNTEAPTIVGFRGVIPVLPQIIARTPFSPIVTNAVTNMAVTATGIASTNVTDFEPVASADIIFNSPVDKIVIFNSEGVGDGSIDLMNLVSCAPSLNINKVSIGGTGSFTFNTTASNGFTAKTIATTAVNIPVSSGYSYLTAANTATTVTETILSGWNLVSAVCIDGNNLTVTSSLAGNVLTLPAGSVRLDTAISCTFTNSVITPPNISLVKSCSAPANCTTVPQLPGTDLTYKIMFTNSGGQGALNMALVDKIPSYTDYKLGSAAVNLGSTGLTLVIDYSSDYDPLNPTAATWSYTPVSTGGGAAAGYDRLVKAVRWRVTAGVLSNIASANFGDVSFITKIR